MNRTVVLAFIILVSMCGCSSFSGPSDQDIISVCEGHQDYGISDIRRGQSYYSSGDSKLRIPPNTKIYPIRVNVKGNKFEEDRIQTDRDLYSLKQSTTSNISDRMRNTMNHFQNQDSYNKYPRDIEYYFYYDEFGALSLTNNKPI